MLMNLAPLFLLHAVKSAVPGVDRNDIHADHTDLPNRAEQHAVADYLDREMAKIDALVVKVREAIDRLKGLRAALISAAVTGKIDVRGASARSRVGLSPAALEAVRPRLRYFRFRPISIKSSFAILTSEK